MTKGKITIKVAQDGTGAYRRIGDALAVVRDYRDVAIEIAVAKGIYRERLEITTPHITLSGEDAENTVIVYQDYAYDTMPDGEKRGTFRTPSVFIDTHHFTARNITFQNDAGQGDEVGQALAVYADGDVLCFENCRFLGYQDTLFTAPLPLKEMQPGGFRGPKEFAPRINGRHLYKDCYIEGNIDFIFGGATAYFEGCELFTIRREHQDVCGYVTAASTLEGQEYGYVFNHCRFTSNCPEQSVYLGRPWRNHAKVVIMNSELGAHICAAGWHDWNKADAWETVFFAEYHNFGKGAEGERAPFVKKLTDAEAACFTREKVLGFSSDFTNS